MFCFNAKGEPLWERRLNLGQGPYQITACGRAVVVTQRAGSAVWVEPDGRIEWRLGEAGEPLAAALAATLSRGVLFVPGEKIRAVDPRGGRVLAEVSPGGALRGLQADAKLKLYALTEQGSLKAYRLASHLAVVGEPVRSKN